MVERKFGIVKVDGNKEKVLKLFDESDEADALAYGDQYSKEHTGEMVSCYLALFDLEKKKRSGACRVYGTWYRKATDGNGHYAIAYKDKEGNGHGYNPFILDEFNSLDEARKKEEEMKREGYYEVMCFELGDYDEEEITWSYVIKNRV